MELLGFNKFLFITMMRAAIEVRQQGLQEEDWLALAKSIWETLETNGAFEMREIVTAIMMKDIGNYLNDGE